jgi:hypothetical protein
MAWSSTKARVTGKIAAGGFKQPNNTLAEAIDTGAGIMAQGIMKRGEEERQEKREAKKAAAAEARRLAAAQATKEAEAKKLARNAKILAQDFTGTTDNAAAVTYFQNQLELMGGDVSAVISSTENRIKSKQLEFVAPTTKMVDTPFQGPNVPADPKISDLGVGFGPDGEIETGSNLGAVGTTSQTDEAFRVSDVAEIAADPTSSYSTQAQEMQRIFDERGTPLKGTTLPEDGSVEVNTAGGVRIKPFGETPEDIDISGIKTFADWQAFGSNLRANPTKYSEAWRQEYEDRGNQLFREYLVTADANELKTSIAVDPNMDESKRSTIENAITIKQSGQWQDIIAPSNLAGKSSADINNLIIVAKASGATDADVTLASQISDEIKKVEDLPTYKKYGDEANNYNSTLKQIELAKNDEAGEEVISRLESLAAAQQRGEIAKQNGVPGQKVYEAVVTLPGPDKKQAFMLVVEKPGADGKVQMLDSTGRPLVEGTDYTFLRTIEGEESKALHKISVQTNKYNQEAQTAKVAIVEGLINSEQALAFAREDPRVRNASGDVAQAITNFVRSGSGVLQVMESLFKGQADDYMVTEEQFRAAVAKNAPNASGDLVDAIVSGDVQELGDKTAMFEASMLSLVFRAGRMEGQSGNAMSNKDFERLSEMLNVKGGYEAFEQTLRTFMADKIRVFDVKAQGVLTGPPNDFKAMYGYLPILQPTTFSDFVTQYAETNKDTKLTEAYQNTVSYSPTVTKESSDGDDSTLLEFINSGSVTISVGTGKAPLTKQQVDFAIEEINTGNLSEEEKSKRLENIFKNTALVLNTTPEKLKKIMGY